MIKVDIILYHGLNKLNIDINESNNEPNQITEEEEIEEITVGDLPNNNTTQKGNITNNSSCFGRA